MKRSFFAVFALTSVIVIAFSVGIIPTNAQDEKLLILQAPDLQVSVPGLPKLGDLACEEGTCRIPWLAQYIAGIQRYGIATVGILAVIGLMVGGIVWLTAGGNQERIGSAKTIIGSSVMGLVLMFSSYMILYVINPNLTELQSLNVKSIDRVDLDAHGA